MSSADNATQKTIVLISSDGEAFEVEAAVALQSETIKNVLDVDFAGGTTVPVPNVNSYILAKVIEYCKYQTAVDGDNAAGRDAREFDTSFVKFDYSTLIDLLLAANFLNIGSLIDLMAYTVADMLKGMKTKEIRKAFNVANEFSPEEEEEVRGKNAWAFH